VRLDANLIVLDADPDIGPELLAAFAKVAANPRQKVGRFFIPRLGRKVCPLVIWDWRRVAFRYLRRVLPRHLWIYVGRRHVASHASRPNEDDRQAGKCLARIGEEKYCIQP